MACNRSERAWKSAGREQWRLKIWLCGDNMVALLFITSNCSSSLLGQYIGRNIERKFRGFSAMIDPFRVSLVIRGGWWRNFLGLSVRLVVVLLSNKKSQELHGRDIKRLSVLYMSIQYPRKMHVVAVWQVWVAERYGNSPDFCSFAIAINLHEGSMPMEREVIPNSTTLLFRLITTYMEAASMGSSYGEVTCGSARAH